MQVLNFIFVLCMCMTAACIVFLVFRISRDQYDDYEKLRIDRIKEEFEGKKITYEGETYKVIVISSTCPTDLDILIPEAKEKIKIIPLKMVCSVEGIPESWLKELKNVKRKYWFKPRFVVGMLAVPQNPAPAVTSEL